MKMWRVRACTSRRLRAERNVSWLTEPKYHRSMINMSMYVARDPVTCDSTARHKHSVLLSVSFRTRRSASRLAERRGSIRLAVVRSCGAEPEASVAVSLLSTEKTVSCSAAPCAGAACSGPRPGRDVISLSIAYRMVALCVGTGRTNVYVLAYTQSIRTSLQLELLAYTPSREDFPTLV